MNSKRENDQDRVLDRTLREWVIKDPLPPRFQERVWARIEDGPAPTTPGLWDLLAEWARSFSPRPRFAWASMTALLIVGAACGTWAAQRENSRLDNALGSRYLRSLDPYQTASPSQ